VSVPRGYTGHARDLTKLQVVRDPHIEITRDVKIVQRADGRFAIFDKRFPLGVDAGVFDDVDAATKEARRIYASSAPVAKKMSTNDEELFEAMARAAANAFTPHAPAFDDASNVVAKEDTIDAYDDVELL
jgi:hypothetical protein